MSAKPFSPPKALVERSVLILLLLLGAGLRLWDSGTLPPGLYHDEAQNGLDALDVLDGKLSLYFEANNGREPLFIYLVAASTAILGRSPLAIRLPSFFIGFLTLALTYDLARVWWGKRRAILALATLAVTFWHIHLSRMGFRAVMLPLCTVLTLGQLARALRDHKPARWALAGACYGLCWYTYSAARFTPVALAALVVYGVLTRGRRLLRHWKPALIFTISALIVLMPLGIYTLRNPDIVLGRIGQVSIFNAAISDGSPWILLGRNIAKALGMVFMRGDRIWRHNLAWRPVWDPALALAFCIGLGAMLARFRRRTADAVTLLWTLTMMAPTVLAEDTPHFLRAAGMLPTLALLPAAGLEAVGQRLAELPRMKLAGWIVPILLLSLGLTFTVRDYFVRYVQAPLTYHWLEGGPVALAGQINARRDAGWDGSAMLHGDGHGETIYLDPQLWNSWITLPFLIPESAVQLLPVAGSPAADRLAFWVWPYRDWEADAIPYAARPAYVQLRTGPTAQGDLDPQPYSIATAISFDPLPEMPEPIADFEHGITLRAALVEPADDGVYVLLWWHAASMLPDRYTVFVHYLRDGERLAQDDSDPGHGHFPTTTWYAGDLILDEHALNGIEPDAARDRLRIGLYRNDTQEILPVMDAAGNPSSDWLEWPVILTESQP